MDMIHLARKYIWWQSPEVSARDPRRVIAQVMNLGTFEDVMALRQMVGAATLAETLRDARPGEFSDRSWHYWHLILDIVPLHQIPPQPTRRFG